jgi:hypothetical protein
MGTKGFAASRRLAQIENVPMLLISQNALSKLFSGREIFSVE